MLEEEDVAPPPSISITGGLGDTQPDATAAAAAAAGGGGEEGAEGREQERGGGGGGGRKDSRARRGSTTSVQSGSGRQQQHGGGGGGNGNPLAGKQMTEMPSVGEAISVQSAPSLAPKRRGKVQDGADQRSGGPSHEGSALVGAGLATFGAMPLIATESFGNMNQSTSQGDFGNVNAASVNLGVSQRAKRRHTLKSRNMKNHLQAGGFTGMLLGAGGGDEDTKSIRSARRGGDNDNWETKSSRSMRARSIAGGSEQAGGLGGLVGDFPQDDNLNMLIPAELESPDQIFMPNMKREPYVPVRLARDKIKQALAEIAEHNAKHYSAIDTMEKQYEILRASMEHQVATYAKKLTHHYNTRVADLDKQLKERLSSGQKGQAFAQLMRDVESWKNRANDAESELEQVKNEMESLRKRNVELDEQLKQAKSSSSSSSSSLSLGRRGSQIGNSSFGGGLSGLGAGTNSKINVLGASGSSGNNLAAAIGGDAVDSEDDV